MVVKNHVNCSKNNVSENIAYKLVSYQKNKRKHAFCYFYVIMIYYYSFHFHQFCFIVSYFFYNW